MVIATLAVFFNLIQPAYRESQDLKGRILSKEIALKNEQNAANQVKNLLEQYRGDQSPQIAVSNALPPENDQAQVVYQLQVLAAANRLSVQSIALSQPCQEPEPGRFGPRQTGRRGERPGPGDRPLCELQGLPREYRDQYPRHRHLVPGRDPDRPGQPGFLRFRPDPCYLLPKQIKTWPLS